MSFKVHDRELASVIALPPQARYNYLLGKVADWKEVWSIADEGGWVLMGDSQGRELVPIWPAERFAAVCCILEWEGRTPKRIPLADWMSKWVPGMQADKRDVAVFPILTGEGVNKGIVVDPSKLAKDLEEALSAYDEE
jgi:hypothetical protein